MIFLIFQNFAFPWLYRHFFRLQMIFLDTKMLYAKTPSPEVFPISICTVLTGKCPENKIFHGNEVLLTHEPNSLLSPRGIWHESRLIDPFIPLGISWRPVPSRPAWLNDLAFRRNKGFSGLVGSNLGNKLWKWVDATKLRWKRACSLFIRIHCCVIRRMRWDQRNREVLPTERLSDKPTEQQNVWPTDRPTDKLADYPWKQHPLLRKWVNRSGKEDSFWGFLWMGT